MADNRNELGSLMAELFNNILKYEERALMTEEFKDITINDMHAIEAIGAGKGRSMSNIAKDLDVTVGTLTITMNNLVKKGYVRRSRSAKDRRVVLVSLTDKGRLAFEHHTAFHERLLDSITGTLDETRLDALLDALKIVKEHYTGTQQP